MEHSGKMKPFLIFCVTTYLMTSGGFCVADDTPQTKLSMQLLYHDLDMKNQKAKHELKVSLDLGDMEAAYRACIGAHASQELCRSETATLSDKLYARTHDAQMLAESRKQTELLKQQEAAQEKNTSITIIEDNPYSWHPGHRRPPYQWERPTPAPRETPHFTPKPGFVPQNRFQAGDGF